MGKYHIDHYNITRYISWHTVIFSCSTKISLLFSAKQVGQRAKLGRQGGNFVLWGPDLFCRVKFADVLPTNYSEEHIFLYLHNLTLICRQTTLEEALFICICII